MDTIKGTWYYHAFVKLSCLCYTITALWYYHVCVILSWLCHIPRQENVCKMSTKMFTNIWAKNMWFKRILVLYVRSNDKFIWINALLLMLIPKRWWFHSNVIHKMGIYSLFTRNVHTFQGKVSKPGLRGSQLFSCLSQIFFHSVHPIMSL